VSQCDVAVRCCSVMLQCVAVWCCSVSQCDVAVRCCSVMLQCVAVWCCSVSQCDVVVRCCSVMLQRSIAFLKLTICHLPPYLASKSVCVCARDMNEFVYVYVYVCRYVANKPTRQPSYPPSRARAHTRKGYLWPPITHTYPHSLHTHQTWLRVEEESWSCIQKHVNKTLSWLHLFTCTHNTLFLRHTCIHILILM